MNSSLPGWLLVLLAATVNLAVAAETQSEQSLANRAQQLAELRQEVETLSLDLETAKEDTRSRLQTLDAQKTDLGVQQGRAQFQLDALQKEHAEKQALVASASSDPAYRTALLSASAELKTQIETGLPFRTQQRLEALDELTGKISSEQLSNEQSMARLWAFAEDELRLARENAKDRQVISFDNREVLADVVRLGMVALYFRTPDDQVGRAVKNGDNWTWVAFEDRGEANQVLALFDGFERGLRTGIYSIPNPITEAQR